MAMYQPKENKGSLFKNKRKEKDTQADYRGTVNVEGKLFWINGWINKDKNGDSYMGLSVQPVQERQEQQQKYKVVGGSDVDKKPDPNDDIPF
jgi:hypothetical protein